VTSRFVVRRSRGERRSPETIGQIAPGGSARATVVWDTRSQNGTHALTATADPANVIAERDESNNAVTRHALVQGSKASLAP
jgi:subtilase family serine protease